MKVTGSNFGELLASRFPQVRLELEEWHGLAHLQMMELRILAENSVRLGNWDTAQGCIELLDEIFGDCDDEISNVVHVSFLEHVDPSDNVGKELFKYFTPRLKKGWHDIEAYNRGLPRSQETT